MGRNAMKITVAMSGGVDSSVAARLLIEQGHEVVGVFLENGASGSGPGSSSAEDARTVAADLGVGLEVLDLSAEFAELIDYFVDEYCRGRTPNPCVMCNRTLKFRRLLDSAAGTGAEAVATGHHARLSREGERIAIRRGVDPDKDQSYVLSYLTQEQLAKLVFPVGDLQKSDVREIARQAGLDVHSKAESQDICFIPEGDYRPVLRDRMDVGPRPGDIIDEKGQVVGQHEGIQFYTIGQRRGLRVALGSARYVVKLDPLKNEVHIGPDEDLRRKELTVSRINWVALDSPGEPLRCTVQIRYNHQPANATLYSLAEDRARVTFDEPQRAIAPGQVAVFYDDDIVLGGGWID